MFKNLSNLASMMKQASQIGGRMDEMQSQLREQRVTGTAGGGLVVVETNGLGETLKLTIDESLIAKGEKDVIEDLVRAANNDAHAKSRAMHVDAMKSLAGGMSLPGLEDALSQLTGGAGSEDDGPPNNPDDRGAGPGGPS